MTLTVAIKHRLGDFTVDADMTCGRGITALFGPSGSGKTSVVRAIGGLIRPDEGRIVLDEEILLDTARRVFTAAHRRRFGYVFQEARLFPHLTVRQNLSYGRWFSRTKTDAADFERIVGLLGIEGLLPRQPEKLSGGEKQRVAIGRALLSSPRLLLMDEPLAALDEARKAEILPYLERLRDEMDIAIIYVSHSMAEVARLADRVVVLRNGKVEAEGLAVDVLGEPSSAWPANRREAGVVLEGIVTEVDTTHGLALVALKGGTLYVPGLALKLGKTVRVRIPARDVILSTSRPEGLSALNILEGRIVTMTPETDGTIEIRIDCQGDTVAARITTFSAQRLNLRVGLTIYPVIKTVALEA